MSNTTEWRMVPLEPTEEMLDAGWRTRHHDAEGAYAALLSAAPQPPAVEPMTDEMARAAFRANSKHNAPQWRSSDSTGAVVYMSGRFTADELRAILHFAPKE